MFAVKKYSLVAFYVAVVGSIIFLVYKINILSSVIKDQEIKIGSLNSQISLLNQAEPTRKTQEQDSVDVLIKNIGNGHWGNICSQDKVVDGRVDTQSAIVFFDKASCPPPFKTIRVWVMNGTGNW
ncbi:hypothetical protein CO104_00635 [Candidatus Collierbacteria bacterium CG_4_9_14_3_um_filter_43_16]|uniref:Uncharacterized protein n=1 Tax=Candidatus Collierbacteria bacterium CG_4_9_14_3_um_filter_43_16 TaxID=1974532 RepID=A0A2M8BY49_9BACT|nr:MAG: hypothetical protein CO104_00635 [Candidatus Collierbacteria bacterium CG_4_9_14_3_um_filter_43_16]